MIKAYKMNHQYFANNNKVSHIFTMAINRGNKSCIKSQQAVNLNR